MKIFYTKYTTSPTSYKLLLSLTELIIALLLTVYFKVSTASIPMVLGSKRGAQINLN